MGKAHRQSRRFTSQRNDPAGLNGHQKSSASTNGLSSLNGNGEVNRYQAHQKEVESNLPALISGMKSVVDASQREAAYVACAEIFHNPHILKNVNFVTRLLENGILNCFLKGLSDPQISIQIHASAALRNFTYGVTLLDISQGNFKKVISLIEHNFHSNQNDGIQTIIAYLVRKSTLSTVNQEMEVQQQQQQQQEEEGFFVNNKPEDEIVENLLNVLYNLFDISEISISHFTKYSLHGNNLIGLNLLFSYLSSSASNLEILLIVSRILYLVTDTNEILVSKLLSFNEGEYVNFLFSILSPTATANINGNGISDASTTLGCVVC